jgi:hypothetical protein
MGSSPRWGAFGGAIGVPNPKDSERRRVCPPLPPKGGFKFFASGKKKNNKPLDMSIFLLILHPNNKNMAIYNPTDTFGPFSGSVGSITYSKNKGGYYRKLKSNPTNPQTVYQTFARSLLAGFSSIWASSLTDAERLSWQNASLDYPYTNSLGVTYYLSGSDLFITLSVNLVLISILPNFTAPAFQGSAAMTSFTPAVVGATSVEIDFTSIQSAPDPSDFLIWGTPQFSNGIYNYKKRLRQFTVITNATVLPADVTAAFVLRFGAVPPTGAKQGWGIASVNTETGNAGTRMTSTTIAT